MNLGKNIQRRNVIEKVSMKKITKVTNARMYNILKIKYLK